MDIINEMIWWAGVGFLAAYGLWGTWILILFLASKIEERGLK